MKTYNDIYLDIRKRFRAAGIAASELEARLIIGHAVGKTKEELLASGRLFMTEAAKLKEIEAGAERRLKGEPVAYIVGSWEFYGLPVIVNNNVLIPRVDTELLAKEAIRLLKERISGRGAASAKTEKTAKTARVLDLCTGSGCVGLAIAANVPDCRVTLADVSPEALAVCRMNMLACKLSRRTTAIEADILSPPPSLLGSFDIIVCNPPYIKSADLEILDASVRDYEPLQALDGGEDGLKYFKAAALLWTPLLNKKGNLLFECGEGQASDVGEIMSGNGLRKISVHKDTLGIERVLVGTIK